MFSRLAIVWLLVSAACAAERPPQPRRGYLTIWNRNSVSPDEPTFYEILEIYEHATSDFSRASQTSLLEGRGPLAIDAKLVVEDFESEHYVTVVRRRNTGQNIALTTGRGLEIESNCHVLEVFDETFRFTRNDEVAGPALLAAGFQSTCEFIEDDGPPGGDGGAGGDPTPGD